MKHNIDVEGLPEGWKAVAYRPPIQYKDHIFLHGEISICDFRTYYEHLIVEKIQPRRKLSAQEIAEGYDPSSPNGYD